MSAHGHAHDEVPAGGAVEIIRRLADLGWVLRPYRGLLFSTIAAGLLNQVALIGAGVTAAYLVGRSLTGASVDELVPGIVLIVLLILPRTVLPWLDSVLSHLMAFKALVDIRDHIYESFARLAPAGLAHRRSGDLGATVIGDVEQLEVFFAHTLSPLVVAIVIPLVGILGLTLISPAIGLAILPIAILTATVPAWLARRAERQGRRYRAALAELQADAVDSVQGLREILTFGAGERRLEALAASEAGIRDVRLAHGMRAGVEKAAIDALVVSGVVVALVVAGTLVAGGTLAPWDLTVAVVLAATTLGPVATLADVGRDLAVVAAGAERMTTLLQTPARVHERGEAAVPTGTGGLPVSLDGVTFRYEPGLAPALHDVSLRVEAGETVALVGHSGAGKSTTVNLLLRFWDPEAGTVRVGDVDLRDLSADARASSVALVPQDVYLFHDTVRRNLALGRPDATDAELDAATEAALADEFIRDDLPDGYRTLVGERGARLSGGQRQRIGIARALLVDSPVLILDEPVSHLDSESERLVAEAITRAREGRTTILIAHRLSTIRLASRVIVLDHGRVVADGPPDELVRVGGPYADLVRVQHDGFVGVDNDGHRHEHGGSAAGG